MIKDMTDIHTQCSIFTVIVYCVVLAQLMYCFIIALQRPLQHYRPTLIHI